MRHLEPRQRVGRQRAEGEAEQHGGERDDRAGAERGHEIRLGQHRAIPAQADVGGAQVRRHRDIVDLGLHAHGGDPHDRRDRPQQKQQDQGVEHTRPRPVPTHTEQVVCFNHVVPINGFSGFGNGFNG